MRRIQPTITLNNAVNNMWIYEYTCWPNFTWDTSALAGKLGDARFRLGRLLGRMEGLGDPLRW